MDNVPGREVPRAVTAGGIIVEEEDPTAPRTPPRG